MARSIKKGFYVQESLLRKVDLEGEANRLACDLYVDVNPIPAEIRTRFMGEGKLCDQDAQRHQDTHVD